MCRTIRALHRGTLALVLFAGLPGTVWSQQDPPIATPTVPPQTTEVVEDPIPPVEPLTGMSGMRLIEDTAGRVVVSEVSIDSPSAAAGVKQGDIITAVEGKRVQTLELLMKDSRKIMTSQSRPEALRLTLLRGRRTLEVAVAIPEARPAAPRAAASDPPVPGIARTAELGLTEANEVVHIRPGSSPEAAGLQPTDVVSSVDGKRTVNFRALQSAFAASRPGPFIPIQIMRNGKLVNVEIEASTTIALHPQTAAPTLAPVDLAERVKNLEAQVEVLTRTVTLLTNRLEALAPSR